MFSRVGPTRRPGNRRRRVFALLALVVPAAASIVLVAQQKPVQPAQQPPAPAAQQPDRQMPPVTFKVEVNYVEADAVVTDAQGNFVRDLAGKDFQIFEDGKPQKISAFSLVEIPIERAERPLFKTQPVEPDVTTNAQGVDGRIYVIVLDDLHTAPLRSMLVRKAARQFIERELGTNDLAAIVTTGGAADTSQEFTSNRTLLLEAVDKFMGKKLRSPTLELLDQYNVQAQSIRTTGVPITDPTEAQRAFYARSMFDDLRRTSELLAGIHGRRKAVVLISEGVDYNIYDAINNSYAGTLRDAARDAIAAATRANVNIYAIDPRGLTGAGEEAIEMGAPPADPSLGLGPQSLMAELQMSQDSLRVLADDTGGFAAVNTNDFRNAFDRIVSENSSYYVLGFYSTNERRDGRYRKLEVKVTRPGLQVRARKGYAAPSGSASKSKGLDSAAVKSAELRDALESPVPMSALKMAVFAAPFKGTATEASVLVTVQMSGQDLKFAEKAGRFDENIEVSLIALDHDGKVRANDRQTLNMALKPETRAVVQQVGFRVVSRLNLPPGRYQLRIAGRATEAQRVGSVYYDLIVPDFTKPSLAMSGIVLTSSRAGAVPTPRPDEELRKALPGPPTTARWFTPSDELALLAEVYDNRATQPHKVAIATTIRADDGRTVFRHDDERQSSELGGKNGGYGYTARVPLKELAPGAYVLRVEARSTLGKDEIVSRELPFTVIANR
ncbi:MAG: VWA domain-containing protein [Bacteroidales bacterium]